MEEWMSGGMLVCECRIETSRVPPEVRSRREEEWKRGVVEGREGQEGV